ncbi:MAG: hypothetical protein KAY56_13555 [Inhella sp.]|nr:hypothetical protein [Inhella sp.]
MRRLARCIEYLTLEHWPQGLACALAMSAALPLASTGRQATAATEASANGGEWPTTLDGVLLRPLATSVVEQRFAARFPGRIARFDGGQAQWVLREVREPTRMLHPAADCYRGLGWRVGNTRLEQDAQTRRWRCFVAERGGQQLRVCERIEGADGSSFTDTSAWYWAALLGQSTGPWRAATRVEVM